MTPFTLRRLLATGAATGLAGATALVLLPSGAEAAPTTETPNRRAANHATGSAPSSRNASPGMVSRTARPMAAKPTSWARVASAMPGVRNVTFSRPSSCRSTRITPA